MEPMEQVRDVIANIDDNETEDFQKHWKRNVLRMGEFITSHAAKHGEQWIDL